MKIVAKKTSFYLIDEFFNDVLSQDYVDGVSFDVVFNLSDELFVFDFPNTGAYDIKQIQHCKVQEFLSSAVFTLDEALSKIKDFDNGTIVYLNIVPVSISVVDDVTLKELNDFNERYVKKLNEILSKYSDMEIHLHSTSRNIINLMKTKLHQNIGVVIYSEDLTPIDVSYYVFSISMIDDHIFEELQKRDKCIILYINDDNDLVYVNQKYNSEKSTALSQKILKDLVFIVKQPILLAKLFDDRLK